MQMLSRFGKKIFFHAILIDLQYFNESCDTWRRHRDTDARARGSATPTFICVRRHNIIEKAPRLESNKKY